MSKKYYLGFVLLLSLFVLGCSESDFTLREKCSKYKASAEKRVALIKSELESDLYLGGVYYSKAQNTCISVTMWPNDQEYTNEQTGALVQIPEEYKNNYDSFEKDLQLLK